MRWVGDLEKLQKQIKRLQGLMLKRSLDIQAQQSKEIFSTIIALSMKDKLFQEYKAKLKKAEKKLNKWYDSLTDDIEA